MSPLVQLLRPHQYAKNVLVFAAPGAAGRLDELEVVARTGLAFWLFCAVSSAGYVVNDLLDVEADRRHPVKRNRPLASGAVDAATARRLFAILVVGALAGAASLGWLFFATLAGYGATSITYSSVLKRVPWVDLLAVSAGFVLRAVAGGAATDTPISGWFLLVVSAGALLVITGKRLGELDALGARSPSRKVLARYRVATLRQVAAIAAGLAVGGYATWAAAEANNQASNSDGSILLRLTALPFAAAIGRYLMLSLRGAGETPETLIVRDRLMMLAGACWTSLYAVGLYL